MPDLSCAAQQQNDYLPNFNLKIIFPITIFYSSKYQLHIWRIRSTEQNKHVRRDGLLLRREEISWVILHLHFFFFHFRNGKWCKAVFVVYKQQRHRVCSWDKRVFFFKFQNELIYVEDVAKYISWFEDYWKCSAWSFEFVWIVLSSSNCHYFFNWHREITWLTTTLLARVKYMEMIYDAFARFEFGRQRLTIFFFYIFAS